MTEHSFPEIVRLSDEWCAESKRHTAAANEEDCGAGTEEWMLHAESARIYRKCADQLITAASRGILSGAATPQVRLEARPADDSQEWTEIFPAQLQWIAKQGHQVRAIELPDAAQPARITGARNRVEEAACLIWSELCPGMVMGDDDLPHYEAAARAVLALTSTPSADPMTRPHRGSL